MGRKSYGQAALLWRMDIEIDIHKICFFHYCEVYKTQSWTWISSQIANGKVKYSRLASATLTTGLKASQVNSWTRVNFASAQIPAQNAGRIGDFIKRQLPAGISGHGNDEYMCSKPEIKRSEDDTSQVFMGQKIRYTGRYLLTEYNCKLFASKFGISSS